MKKIFTIIGASMIVASAAAANFSYQSLPLLHNTKKTLSTDVTRISSEGVTSSRMEIRKADSNTSINGTWSLRLGDNYFSDGEGLYDLTVQVSYNSANGTVTLVDPTESIDPITANFDPSTNVLTFTRIYLGTHTTGSGFNPTTSYIYQQPFVYNEETGRIDYQDISATYDPVAGTISFDRNAGISWPAYKSQNETTTDSYLAILDMYIAYLDAPVVANDPNWKDVGMATFQDGWILPGFGEDPSDEGWWYEVPLQQDVNNPDRYRLFDPYHIGPVSELNSSREVGAIVFDVSDPEHVVFERCVSGFGYTRAGIQSFYCYNILGFLMQYELQSPSYIISVYGRSIPYTTFKDKVVTLGSIISEGSTLFDANFGIQKYTFGGTNWGVDPNTGIPYNMETKIFFPGFDFDAVEGIEADNDVQAEYFNLQGIRVINPQPGQIVIERRGNKATKLIVR